MTVSDMEQLIGAVVDLARGFQRTKTEAQIGQHNAEQLYVKLHDYRDAMLLPEATDGTDEGVEQTVNP